MRENVFLVIPTVRDVLFLGKWQPFLNKVSIVVVEDKPVPGAIIPKPIASRVHRFGWNDIRNDFGANEWIFGRKNSSIRNYGFWKAWRMGAETIITIDDDCYPTGDNLVDEHLDNLTFRSHGGKWQTTHPSKKWMYTRGFPYQTRELRETWISHGLWSGALDLDGKTEVANGKLLNEPAYPPMRQVIPRGVYYPMCSMNLAFVREATPVMFFPMMGQDPQGKSWGYDRFDDIWAGILSKKILDHLGYAVINGSPFVEHRKKSIPRHNMNKEKAGMKVNEDFWRWVDAVALTKKTPTECYLELAEKIHFPDEAYFRKLREGMMIWARLFI